MKILILGGGLQGSACAYDLLRQDDVESVTVADQRGAPAAEFVPDDSRLFFPVMDFHDERSVSLSMERHDVALSAAPYWFNASLASNAVDNGCSYADLGGNTEIVRQQLQLMERARDVGVTLIPDIGLAPGMVNVLAAEGIRRLDRPRSVRMYVGGLPRDPKPPLNYTIVYSLEGMLDYYTTPSWILRGGELEKAEALSEVETLQFGGVGELEAFHTGGGASTQPMRYEGEVETLEYKTLRYPGHAGLIRGIRDLGLLEEEPVSVGPVEVSPRELFVARVEPELGNPDAPDLVALRVVVEGERDGRQTRLVWELLDTKDEEAGISAMMRCTGFSLSIAGLLLGRGEIDKPGVYTADQILPFDRYVEELSARGIDLRFEEESA